MKKSRILALLFCLVMLAGFLPPQAQAAGVARFEADTLDSPGPIWTYTRIRVSVDTGSMTATVSFRRYRDDTDWEYIENNYPDLLSDSHTICSNTYGFLTADARPIGDKGTTYELTNLQWQTEPYIFDGGEVSGKILVKYTTLLFESGYVYIRPSARLDYPSAFCGVEMGSGTKFNLTDDDVEYLDANPTPQNRDYTIGRDNFGFVNRRDSFFQTGGRPLRWWNP